MAISSTSKVTHRKNERESTELCRVLRQEYSGEFVPSNRSFNWFSSSSLCLLSLSYCAVHSASASGSSANTAAASSSSLADGDAKAPSLSCSISYSGDELSGDSSEFSSLNSTSSSDEDILLFRLWKTREPKLALADSERNTKRREANSTAPNIINTIPIRSPAAKRKSIAKPTSIKQSSRLKSRSASAFSK
ncbi:hypothetical protein P5673_017708 [Acropora cervicornis]|uniref:Uncharacterized protein n=1 Tax=Acropora cervicornis TaxID=6130 RepID=A0AAD9QE68_ACRCE|nr:hypothetical protein P5673_017708 [Acropora cervicornis]